MTCTRTHGLYRGKELIDFGSEKTLQEWANQDSHTPPLKVYPVKVIRVERKGKKRKGKR